MFGHFLTRDPGLRSMDERIEDQIVGLTQRDPRYAKNAYVFVLEALDFTIHRVGEEGGMRNRHIGGRELLEGIRDLARDRFGPLAKEVFNQWGVLSTEDFGQIVFSLVAVGLLQRRPQDTIQDFADGYDFEHVFERDYRMSVPWEELLS